MELRFPDPPLPETRQGTKAAYCDNISCDEYCVSYDVGAVWDEAGTMISDPPECLECEKEMIFND